MKLTKAQAKKICMGEWNDRRKGGIGAGYYCAYCEKYRCNKKCPLIKLWGFDCLDERSPFQKWVNAETGKTKLKWADRMYQDIKRS